MSRGSVTSRGRRDITLWLSAASPRRAGLAGPRLLPRYLAVQIISTCRDNAAG